jgi:hypothetical protein
MQNIHSLVSVMLDLSSMHYAWWHDNILLTLRCYTLSDHVLMHTTYIGVLFWDRMDSVVNSWIYDTISPNLQDATWQRGHTAHDAWLALKNHFLSNCETCTLHIDATFQSFIQGDLSINDYYRKTKGIDIIDHILVLNVLCGLNKNFEHLHAIFTHVTPFLLFPKVLDDLHLEEI